MSLNDQTQLRDNAPHIQNKTTIKNDSKSAIYETKLPQQIHYTIMTSLLRQDDVILTQLPQNDVVLT